jgi:hypothetical protein
MPLAGTGTGTRVLLSSPIANIDRLESDCGACHLNEIHSFIVDPVGLTVVASWPIPLTIERGAAAFRCRCCVYHSFEFFFVFFGLFFFVFFFLLNTNLLLEKDERRVHSKKDGKSCMNHDKRCSMIDDIDLLN